MWVLHAPTSSAAAIPCPRGFAYLKKQFQRQYVESSIKKTNQQSQSRNPCPALAKEGPVAGLAPCRMCIPGAGASSLVGVNRRVRDNRDECDGKERLIRRLDKIHGKFGFMWNILETLIYIAAIQESMAWMGSLIFLATGAGVAVNLIFVILSVLYIILCLYFSLCTRQRLIHIYMQDVVQAHR